MCNSITTVHPINRFQVGNFSTSGYVVRSSSITRSLVLTPVIVAMSISGSSVLDNLYCSFSGLRYCSTAGADKASSSW